MLVVPESQYTEDIVDILPIDSAGAFINECGDDNFYVEYVSLSRQTVSVVSHFLLYNSGLHVENYARKCRRWSSGDPLRARIEMVYACSPNSGGFCRDLSFALTTEYNNGAVSCGCNTEGSNDFECDLFGGQCNCKPNIIGRECSQCRTGYYGFPDCQGETWVLSVVYVKTRAGCFRLFVQVCLADQLLRFDVSHPNRPFSECVCPSGLCDPVSGQCVCPPRVTGANCNECFPRTFGYDPLIGCEDCNCEPLGVENNDLDCNINTGQCR